MSHYPLPHGFAYSISEGNLKVSKYVNDNYKESNISVFVDDCELVMVKDDNKYNYFKLPELNYNRTRESVEKTCFSLDECCAIFRHSNDECSVEFVRYYQPSILGTKITAGCSEYEFNKILLEKNPSKVIYNCIAKVPSLDSLEVKHLVCNTGLGTLLGKEFPFLETLTYSYSNKVIPDMRIFFKYFTTDLNGEEVMIRRLRFSNLTKVSAGTNSSSHSLKHKDLLSIEELIDSGLTFELLHGSSIELRKTNWGVATKLNLCGDLDFFLYHRREVTQLLQIYGKEVEIEIQDDEVDCNELIKNIVRGKYEFNVTKVSVAIKGHSTISFVFNDNVINQSLKVKSARSVYQE